jgi:hypothetical protein
VKRLHILRSEPDETTKRLLAGMPGGKESNPEVPLFRGAVDYARLVEDIFKAEQVICWW